jgi:hypothetical protein
VWCSLLSVSSTDRARFSPLVVPKTSPVAACRVLNAALKMKNLFEKKEKKGENQRSKRNADGFFFFMKRGNQSDKEGKYA